MYGMAIFLGEKPFGSTKNSWFSNFLARCLDWEGRLFLGVSLCMFVWVEGVIRGRGRGDREKPAVIINVGFDQKAWGDFHEGG